MSDTKQIIEEGAPSLTRVSDIERWADLERLDDAREKLQGVAAVLNNMSLAQEAGGGHEWDHRSLMLLSDVLYEQVMPALDEVRESVLANR